MKLSDILVVTLFLVMGSLIFVMKKMQEADGAEPKVGATASVSAPQIQKPPKSDVPQLRLTLSDPATAGSYGRLPLEAYLQKDETASDSVTLLLKDSTPKDSASQNPELENGL